MHKDSVASCKLLLAFSFLVEARSHAYNMGRDRVRGPDIMTPNLSNTKTTGLSRKNPQPGNMPLLSLLCDFEETIVGKASPTTFICRGCRLYLDVEVSKVCCWFAWLCYCLLLGA